MFPSAERLRDMRKRAESEDYVAQYRIFRNLLVQGFGRKEAQTESGLSDADVNVFCKDLIEYDLI